MSTKKSNHVTRLETIVYSLVSFVGLFLFAISATGGFNG